MFGLGKKRSKLGRFLDKKGYTQQDLSRAAKIDKATASKVCNDDSYLPSGTTIQKIMKAIKQLDPNKKAEDFFNL
ncbi:helix-turn-helix transcriptional regulator [Priestia koreensis]|uniref:helix-turn-helix domain-containing protein n=1 Tax=Priestia koreensis TaxID=284581 RepID=UPI003019A0C8